jgi:hypothetical protein
VWRVAFTCTVAACGFTPTNIGAMHDAANGSADAPPQIDAHLIDAPKTWQVIDTLVVPCTQTPVTSIAGLTTTGMYHLRASGECTVSTSSGSLSDAEYFAYNIDSPTDAGSGVDNGIAIDDTNPGPTKTRWGTYNGTDHIYEIPFTGANAQITAEYWDSNYPNNTGQLKLEILEYK